MIEAKTVTLIEAKTVEAKTAALNYEKLNFFKSVGQDGRQFEKRL